MVQASAPQRPIGLRQFRNGSCYSYLIWDKQSREAIIVDPCVEAMEDYRSFMGENSKKLVAAVDTQLHPDRLSATHLFRAEYGVPVCMAASTESERVDRKLQDREKLPFGSSALEVLSAPGQAGDGLAFLAGGLLLSGHVLALGGASPRYPGRDPALLAQSRAKLLGLDGGTLVFPARDSNHLLFSTLAHEKAQGASSIADEADPPKLRSPADVEACLQFNQQRNPANVPLLDPCETLINDADSLPSISPAKLAKKLEKRESGSLVIDVRELPEFQGGHIPGSVNMPVWDLPFRLHELSRYKKVYVASLSGLRGDWRGPSASRTLAYVGLPNVIAVEGGIRAWAQLGYELEPRKAEIR